MPPKKDQQTKLAQKINRKRKRTKDESEFNPQSESLTLQSSDSDSHIPISDEESSDSDIETTINPNQSDLENAQLKDFITIRPSKIVDAKVLGEGGFGKVYQVESAKDKNTFYALKQISKAKLNRLKDGDQAVQTEIKIQKEFNHPNICKCYNHWFIKKHNCYYLLLEYLPKSLDQVIKLETLSELQIFDYFQQLINVVEYLNNQKNVMHRDIKPENILIDSKDNIKLTVFGLAKIEKNQKINVIGNSQVGTFGFQAPELYKCRPKYDASIEKWSIGVTLHEMLNNGKSYFDQKSRDWVFANCYDQKSYRQNIDLRYPDNPNVTDEAKDLVECLLDKNPKKRPTFDQIRQHKWYEKNKEKLDKLKNEQKDKNVNFEIDFKQFNLEKQEKKKASKVQMDEEHHLIVKEANYPEQKYKSKIITLQLILNSKQTQELLEKTETQKKIGFCTYIVIMKSYF